KTVDDDAYTRSLCEQIRLLEQQVRELTRARAREIIAEAADGTGPLPAATRRSMPQHAKRRRPNPFGLHVVRGLVPPILGGYIAAHGRKLVVAAAGLTLAGGAAGLTPSIIGPAPGHAATRPVPVYSQRGDTATPLAPLHAPGSGSWRGGGLVSP